MYVLGFFYNLNSKLHSEEKTPIAHTSIGNLASLISCITAAHEVHHQVNSEKFVKKIWEVFFFNRVLSCEEITKKSQAIM